jgi:hydroxymethylpyrimidine pyrophosphatase-like HAD family hydrolase
MKISPKTNIALVLDIDKTLTPPRKPLNKTMAETLEKLSIPFWVAAGSHIRLLQHQFFEPLFTFGFRKQFEAFLGNGAIQYHCDYTKKMSIKEVAVFNLRSYLGETSYQGLRKILKESLVMDQFRMPPSLSILDNRLVDRVSMLNLCPIGRMDREDQKAKKNREAFIKFDKATSYRDRMLDFLNQKLASLITKKQLKITLGGETSFDIGIAGEDKTKPIRILLQDGLKKVIFIGDALYPNGNDASIREFIKVWPSGSPCPVEAIQVNSWKETKKILENLDR